MSDKLNSKFINIVGSGVVLYYVWLLRHNDSLFVLDQYQINQIIYASIYVSIIIAVSLSIVSLPLNFYYLTIVSNLLIFSVRQLNSNGYAKCIFIGLYLLAIACLWWSVIIIYPEISDKKTKPNSPKKTRVKKNKNKLFLSKHNKTYNTLTKIKKLQQKEERKPIFVGFTQLHRIMMRNCVITNALWHTMNVLMLMNNNLNNDNMLDIMWIYGTLEYINYQTKIIQVDNTIIAPYILIIFLLINYNMLLLLRLSCIIICLSMIIYKLQMIIYNNTDATQENNKEKQENKKPIVVYVKSNGEFQDIDDDDLTTLVESLPLDYLFSSLFSSFGVIMAPSIISVFWRVWHLIPLLINGEGPGHASGEDPICSCSRCLYQKTQIVAIQFIQSMFVMYVVVKEYRLYSLWKYYKIFDIYSTLFVFALHIVISKLPLVIFSVCFVKYFVYGSKACMNHEDELNPEMGTIKPPAPILLIFYISFVINCWVVYYKVLWQNGHVLYNSIRKQYEYEIRDRSNFHLMDLLHENHFNVLLFHEFDSVKIHVAGLWVHFCGRVFSEFRDDTTIEIIHVVTSMILVMSAAYHHVSWQKRFNNKKLKKFGYFGFFFVFACLATLMVKLYVVRKIGEIVLGFYGIIFESWTHIRNIHIT